MSNSKNEIFCFEQIAPLVGHPLMFGIDIFFFMVSRWMMSGCTLFLQSLDRFTATFLIKATLHIFADLDYYLIDKLFDDMEMVDYWLDRRTLFLEGPLKIAHRFSEADDKKSILRFYVFCQMKIFKRDFLFYAIYKEQRLAEHLRML